MSAIGVCNFVSFYAGTTRTAYNFQNFFVNETKNFYDHVSGSTIAYTFAPFAVTANAGTRGGDRSDAAIVAPSDAIVVNLFVEACASRWMCQIITVARELGQSGEPATVEELSTYQPYMENTREMWMCSRPEINPERAVLRLASPLDAVDGQVPRRVLNNSLVGSIPFTGNITAS